jgi:hypothetical protein
MRRKGLELGRQRLMFDFEALGTAATRMSEMQRLPQDEPVRIWFKPHQSLRTRLAKHEFVLV